MIYACYAMYLIDGNTLTSLSIKNNTLKLYLNSAGAKSFHKSLCVHQRGYTSNTLLCYSPLVNAVVKEHNRWMKVPHRREPVTKNMIHFWLDKYHNKTNPMVLEAALLDWMILGAKTGFRKSEWCQDVSDIRKNKFNRNIDNTIIAFIRDDWEFTCVTKNYKNLPTGDINYNVLKITWRYQKNNQNGEIIPFVRDNREPPSEPLAVFADNAGNKTFIHNLHVRSYLREAATNVYKIKDESKLKLFTCHSIRVGACVALHVGGASQMDIKSRLRWRSDSIQMYLHHVVQLGNQHNKTYNTSNPDDLDEL